MSKVLEVEVSAEAAKIEGARSKYGVFSREFARRHGIQLLRTTTSWFFLDIAFYSQNLFQKDVFTAVGWIHDGTTMSALSKVFKVSPAQTLIALCSTVPGNWFTVALMDKMGRFTIKLGGFFMMTVFVFGLAISYYKLRGDKCPDGYCGGCHMTFIVLYLFTLFFANFGPNSTTSIVPAKLFPARLQSTCHGISAAAGKAGVIFGAFGFLYASESTHKAETDTGYPTGVGIRTTLLLLGGCNALGLRFYVLGARDKGEIAGGVIWRGRRGEPDTRELNAQAQDGKLLRPGIHAQQHHHHRSAGLRGDESRLHHLIRQHISKSRVFPMVKFVQSLLLSESCIGRVIDDADPVPTVATGVVVSEREILSAVAAENARRFTIVTDQGLREYQVSCLVSDPEVGTCLLTLDPLEANFPVWMQCDQSGVLDLGTNATVISFVSEVDAHHVLRHGSTRALERDVPATVQTMVVGNYLPFQDIPYYTGTYVSGPGGAIVGHDSRGHEILLGLHIGTVHYVPIFVPAQLAVARLREQRLREQREQRLREQREQRLREQRLREQRRKSLDGAKSSKRAKGAQGVKIK